MLSSNVYVMPVPRSSESKVMEGISRDVAFTVSEKVNLRKPSSKSSEKATNSGGVVSEITSVACRAMSSLMGSTRFPFMSMMVVFVIETNVLFTSVPRRVSLLISSRSVRPSVMIILVVLGL